MSLSVTESKMYEAFVEEFTCCWACCFVPLPAQGWPWVWNETLDCAHIVGGAGRKADRRCIARLCRTHHMVFDGTIFRPTRNFSPPKLTLENVVWLKRHFDPEYLDIDYLRSLRHKHELPITPEPMEGSVL